MEVGHTLLVSADPVTIQQFSHALGELSISPDVCRDVTAAVNLLNRRKFDAVIVDLQLGEPRTDCECDASLSIEPNGGNVRHQRQRCTRCSLPE